MPSGVAGSTVNAYALTCGTSSANAPVSVAHQLTGVGQRWGPSNEEHARRRRVPFAATPRDVGHTRIHVCPDEVPAVGPRREVAVVTPRRAERNVYIHAERHAVRIRLPARS